LSPFDVIILRIVDFVVIVHTIGIFHGGVATTTTTTTTTGDQSDAPPRLVAVPVPTEDARVV
jgi:hypothetical protein